MNRTSDSWIAAAKKAGQVAREAAFSTRRAFALDRVTFPRMLAVVLAPRMDGTLTAARRSFNCGLRGER